ncbi:MAG: hypothetical protein GWM87_13170, partial [Xanthomonadales bacterium]|nr:hypothetical protein [Xanthomonadales bacterium]NIX13776.1 hypothetical protein [Xanthomonadales bacterium]
MKQVFIRLICVTFLLSLAVPATTMAQDEDDPPNLASAWVVYPKEG